MPPDLWQRRKDTTLRLRKRLWPQQGHVNASLNYILRKSVSTGTDHKPLVPQLNTKHLDSLLTRVLRVRLCLARFNYTIEYVPGKLLFTADTLSRAPLESSQADHRQAEAIETHVSVIMSQLPADKECLETYSKGQAGDPVCSQLIHLQWMAWTTQSQRRIATLLASQNRPLRVWRPTFVWHTYCCTKRAAGPNPLQDPSWSPRDREMPTSSDHLSVLSRNVSANEGSRIVVNARVVISEKFRQTRMASITVK